MRYRRPLKKWQRREAVYITSLGKALLAWRDPKDIEERISRMDFEVTAPNTITSRTVLLSDLAATRARGYAEEIEESEAGVRCMAVPVFDHLGRPVAAMSIAFPLFRFDEAKQPEIAQTIRDLGLEASLSLGYSPDLGRP
ncbi:IclR family transcriptional regulator domain-containing protein [Celeribacter sp.]|uniref:IclR family transcriptional regulator domain-containing protein n=1 Tax=Celeribacter sp. TaxID=1890673 RepID=UPI003A90CFE9